MQVFKQFHKILLDIFNHMLPTIYTVKSLEPVLNYTEDFSTKGVIVPAHCFIRPLVEKLFSSTEGAASPRSPLLHPNNNINLIPAQMRCPSSEVKGHAWIT